MAPVAQSYVNAMFTDSIIAGNHDVSVPLCLSSKLHIGLKICLDAEWVEGGPIAQKVGGGIPNKVSPMLNSKASRLFLTQSNPRNIHKLAISLNDSNISTISSTKLTASQQTAGERGRCMVLRQV